MYMIKLKEALWEIKVPTGNWVPRSKFLIMFIGVVVGPHMMLILGRLDSNTLGEFGVAFLPFARLLLGLALYPRLVKVLSKLSSV